MRRPFSFLCISIIVGSIIGFIFQIYITGYLLMTSLLFLLFLILFSTRYTYIYICIIFIILGNFITFYNLHEQSIVSLYSKENYILQGTINKINMDNENYHEYDIKVNYLSSPKVNMKIKEKVKLQIHNPGLLAYNLEPGDKIILNRPILVENFQESELNGYQYYLRGQGFKSILKVSSKDVSLINSSDWSLRKSSYKMKTYMENYFDKTLEELNSNILKSIMFGNQGYLDADSLALFSITGTAHIIAVSGLHVGVLVLILDRFLDILSMGRNNKLLIIIVILFLYAYMVGFPVSIIRANCMYYLYIGGYFFERRYDAINSLMMMACLILLYNPFTIFSISFQLSFSATLSILLFYPIIKDYLNILPGSLQSLVGVTLAAQLGTIPIMIYHFKQVSIISPVANVLIVPTLVPLLALGFSSILVDIIFKGWGNIINYITNGLLTYIYQAIKGLSDWPFTNMEIENMDLTHIFIYYLVLLSIYIILWNRKYKRPALEKE